MKNKQQISLTIEKIYETLKENPNATIKDVYEKYNMMYEYGAVGRKLYKMEQVGRLLYKRDNVLKDYTNLEITDSKFLRKQEDSETLENFEREIIYSHLYIIEELDKLIFNNATSTKDKLKAVELRQREYKYENNKYAVEFYKEKNKDGI